MAKKTAAKRAPAAPARRAPATTRREPEHQRAESRPPFLKASDVGRNSSWKPVPGSVRTLNGQFGVQLVVDVQNRAGETFSWGIGVDKPNLRLFVEHLIDNPGKSIGLTTMISQANRPYVAIISDDGEEAPRRRSAAPPVDDDDIPF